MLLARKSAIASLIISVLVAAAWCKSGDIVDTRDGSVYKGAITEEDTAAIFIELSGGSIIRIPRSNILKIQRNTFERGTGFHQHDGFFLSMNTGPASGFVNWARSNDSGSGNAKNSGGGSMIDMKIGGTVHKNLILSFDFLITMAGSDHFSGKGLDVNGLGVTQSPDSTGDCMGVGLGLGVTHYFMPHNVFLNGAMGMGGLMVENKYGLNSDTFGRYSMSTGYYLQGKIGKEWWVSKNWGLGVSFAYVFYSGDEDAADKPVTPYVLDPSYKGEFTAHHFGILFNTTFN